MGSGVKVNICIVAVIVIIANMFKCQLFRKEPVPSVGYSHNTVLSFTELTARNHYISREHTVITEDGYVLTIFRIVKAKKCSHKKKQRPVLIMHGFLQNSDTFLDAGPSAGLAYLLSDTCYDVWVGNQRGNNYGRKHLRLNPDRDEDFWQFSCDEIGTYDVPAMIDYILEQSGADKINYICFSQGCSVYFLMCSERPSYCKRTAVMIALAPSVILEHIDFPARAFLNLAFYFNGIFDIFGVNEIFKKGDNLQEFLRYLCRTTGSAWIEKLCTTCIFLNSHHSGSLTFDTQQLMYGHFLVGTSKKYLIHLAQEVKSGKFQKFDYGDKINLERYNSTQTPEYNLHAVSTPVVLILSKNDKLATIQDTIALSTKLPNVLDMIEISDPEWTHIDMVYSQNIKKMIYPKINEYLEMFSENTK